MATQCRERIFYTWLILDLLTLRSELNGATPTCPLSIYPGVVEVKYGETVRVECRSFTEVPAEALRWEFGKSEIRNSTLVINSLDYNDHKDWNLKATCHGIFTGLDKCQKDINVTIYNLPDNISISTINHTGPMIEGKNYTLHCDVQNVNPVPLLTVNWYKGEYLKKVADFTKLKTQDNNSMTLTISPNRKDAHTLYKCEAELGLKTSTKVSSSPLKVIVYYKPFILEKFVRVPLFPDYSLDLKCEASGYPEPTITWIYNNGIIATGQNWTVEENPGEYTCVASNLLGNDTKVFTVVIEVDYLPLIAGFVAVVVVIISVIFILIYSIYYKNTKMGHYTVEGAKPKAQNGNVAQNGKDNTIPMKKIPV